MFLRKAIHIVLTRKVLVLATAIFAVSASAAFAVDLNGAGGTFVGSTGNDNITAANGDATIWGLGGNDNITAGNGNDTIDANGHCQGVAPGVYPNGLPSGSYCAHGQIPGSNDNIIAGNGNDTVFGGGGPNNITIGCGDDTIYGGPIGHTINIGSGCQAENDMIFLGSGPNYTGSTLNAAGGGGTIDAQNGVKDTITCGKHNTITVYADKGVDVVKNCAHVITTPDPNPSPLLATAKSRLAWHKHSVHKRKAHRKHHRRTRKHIRTKR